MTKREDPIMTKKMVSMMKKQVDKRKFRLEPKPSVPANKARYTA